MKKPDISHQDEIFNTLLKHMSKPELVAVMQTRLGLSKASCYKYINGATAISYDQMSALQHLSPISEVLRRGESDMNPSDTWWYYPPFITDMNISSYLESLFIYLSQLDNTQSKIIMTTYEVPIFYYMYYPDLFAFKLFCWSKTIWMQSDFFSDKFDAAKILTPEILNLIKNLCDKYNSISAAEYWTTNMMSNTVRQISYFRDVDMFQNIGQIKKLTQDLCGLCGLMRKMVENVKKFLSNKSSSGAEFNISQNDIYYTNNIFIVNNINTNYVFSSFDNPNYIFSKDIRIYQKTLSWIKNMDRHCISLSKSNEIVRSKFFHLLQQSIEEIEL